MSVNGSYDWWASLKHGGMLIAPSRLREHFPERLDPLPHHLAVRLRRDVTRSAAGDGDEVSALMDTVLERVLGLGKPLDPETGRWLKASDVSTEWTRRAITGEAIRPRRVWLGAQGAELPVFFDTYKRLGIGRSRRRAARVVEWLRNADRKIALLTNGQQWRLIYAGLDHSSFAEWDTALWFEEGEPGPQVTALRALLSRDAVEPPSADVRSKLLDAIEASRKGQAELSSVLGENVRLAVERLIREHGSALEGLDQGVEPNHIYLAATRIIMRMVVILFSEARDLLPRDNPVYHGSYGLQGLREELDRIGGGSGAERLRHRFGAWPRILGLFRLVYFGSPHPSLPVHRYGGGLFEPGSVESEDPVRRALMVFENREKAPSDHAIYEILRRLTQSKVRVRHGRASTWVDAPVDFSDLSSEYIGILYEGLLDYQLRRVPEGETVVFLNLGDQPALPVSRLEAMEDKDVEKLLDKFKTRSKGPTLTEDAGEEEKEDDEEVEEELSDLADDEAEEVEEEPPTDVEEEEDARQVARARASEWARRAVVAGKLVSKPRSKSKEKLQGFEAEVDVNARRLVDRVFLPGEWYLVRYGGTRKGSGTFYTRPGLAVPTAQRTLRPLAYERADEEEKKGSEAAVGPVVWSVRQPEEILALQVCDPACGSGSFLVAALRFLTEALAESLHAHDRIAAQGASTLVTLALGDPGGDTLAEEVLPCPVDSDEFEERLRARLKRYVVERCIYGVDLDPLAVELCRLSLWVETMDRELPFSFLDHKIKCGNSLVGCWFDRFRDYPALAFEREGGDKGHSNGVHFEKGDWTGRLKSFRNGPLKEKLAEWIAGQGQLLEQVEGEAPENIHDEAMVALENMHALRPDQAEERRRVYEHKILGSPALDRLKQAFDTWCAVWFWPPDELEAAPLPADLANASSDTLGVVMRLQGEERFFHWELEFPDVFISERSGFDAIVGNPPWDIQKPNSKEFFSNLDPLYRTYGKQEALRKQTELFESSRRDEEAWLRYQSRFKALSNFLKHVAWPFGDPTGEGGDFSIKRGKANNQLHDEWRRRRRGRRTFGDPEHPFRNQGSADINTYKLFLEQAHALLSSSGRLGLIIPSGLYTDKGTVELRRLLLERCRWEWLFGFENREAIFDIHRSFKFCPVIVEKGAGHTEALRATFMRRALSDWEDAEQHVNQIHLKDLRVFSREVLTFLEIRSSTDRRFALSMYSGGTTLGDFCASDSRAVLREVDKTNDSSYFLSKKDVNGLRAEAPKPDFRDPRTRAWLFVRDLHPVIEGKNVHLYDNTWAEPQIVMTGDNIKKWFEKKGGRGGQVDPAAFLRPRIVFREIAAPTNERSMISTVLPSASLTTYTLRAIDEKAGIPLWLIGVLNSLVFDYVTRMRGNGHLSTCYELLPLPRVDVNVIQSIEKRVESLTGPFLGPEAIGSSVWALETRDRALIRAEIDALAALVFDVDIEALEFILRDDPTDPIGFWRVDSDAPHSSRAPQLAVEAYRALHQHGMAGFSDAFREGVRSETLSPSARISWSPEDGWHQAWADAGSISPDYVRLSFEEHSDRLSYLPKVAEGPREGYGSRAEPTNAEQGELFES